MNRRQMTDEGEEYEVSESWLTRLKRKIGLEDDPEDGYEEDEPGFAAKGLRGNSKVVLRVQQARPTEISVRLAPKTLTDAQAAADELKQRRPVILNLEKTDGELALRMIDFISGVTYALDGYYQRVGAKVFLFTPSNVGICVEDEIDQEQRDLFFNRD
ncbi:MAG: cell division protein SepF [Armatimonadota bacterium]